MSSQDPSWLPAVCFCHSPAGPWGGVMTDLEEQGVALVSGLMDAWAGHLPEGPGLRRILGEDAHRYRRTPAPLQAKFASTRLMMKSVASAALRCSSEDVELGYSVKGRVFIRGQDNTFLSLSHTADVAVVAISCVGPVGVDIERSSRDLDGCDITSMMCTPPERDQLLALPASTRRAALLRTWTLKEAYSKALGQGLHFPFTEFGFDVATRAGQAVLKRADHSDVRDPLWDVWAWRSLVAPESDQYTLALAAPHPDQRRPGAQAVTAGSGALADYLAVLAGEVGHAVDR